MDINTILHTKHSHVIGNSIIIKQYQSGDYKIKTDYGNEMVMSEGDILNLFNISNDDTIAVGAKDGKIIREKHKYSVDIISDDNCSEEKTIGGFLSSIYRDDLKDI